MSEQHTDAVERRRSEEILHEELDALRGRLKREQAERGEADPAACVTKGKVHALKFALGEVDRI